MKLLVATNNRHKMNEFRRMLAPFFDEIYSMKEARIALDVVEDGASFAENALKKAVETLAVAQSFDAVLSDDSGLCVDALDGAPGIYSARFAGVQDSHNTDANNAKLMECMADVPDGQRGARFVCALALVRKSLPPLIIEGSCEGEILREPRGENGFGYDPYFLYPPLNKTFAELATDEKNAISHRARALKRLYKSLKLLHSALPWKP